MKKFKYKIGEIVLTLGMSPNPSWANYRELIITNRKKIGNSNYYEANLLANNDLDIKYYVDNDFPEFDGDCNYLIEEKYLYPESHKFTFDIPECGNNGCEIITNLLEDKETQKDYEEIEELKFLNKCIERSQTLINSYGDAIYALQKSIEEECININKLKNKIAVLTEDDILYASTFIDTIED